MRTTAVSDCHSGISPPREQRRLGQREKGGTTERMVAAVLSGFWAT